MGYLTVRSPHLSTCPVPGIVSIRVVSTRSYMGVDEWENGSLYLFDALERPRSLLDEAKQSAYSFNKF